MLTKKTMARSYNGNKQHMDDEDRDDAAAEAPAVELVALSDDEFKAELARVIPHLRAFGRSLSGSGTGSSRRSSSSITAGLWPAIRLPPLC